MTAPPPDDRVPPLDLEKVQTYPLDSRQSKVSLADFARPHARGDSLAAFLESLPRILGAQGLRSLAGEILRARSLGKPILWGIGGQTSEDVEAGLGSGAFGMARETGEEINRAITLGDADGLGLGASVGRYLVQRQPPHLAVSVLAAAHRLGLPATVHVAVGTDIVHMHPACNPSALGRASHLDFRILAAHVARLSGGGVYLNVGSAVLLPEVFLKAVTLARNLGHEIADFATANLDFIQSYRPNTNVVERPTRGVGRGYSLTGHHEILVPLLAAALIEAADTTP
jgi:hypothetical protein